MKAITLAELEEARDKVRWGRERRSLAMSEKEKISTAWHEAGHAIVNVLLEHTHPLHKVTIIPRANFLGATMYLPEGDKYSTQRKEALDLLAVTCAGRVSEELFTKDVSNGAAGDIKQMTRLARKMVCEWGMSDALGMVEYGEHEDYVFLARDMTRSRDYSESTAMEIDREVRRLVDEAYNRAKKIILENRDKLEVIAKALLEYETLDAAQIKEIIAARRIEESATQGESASAPSAAAGRRSARVSRAHQTGFASRRSRRARASLSRAKPSGFERPRRSSGKPVRRGASKLSLGSCTRRIRRPFLAVGIEARYAYSMLILCVERTFAIRERLPGLLSFSIMSTSVSTTNVPRDSKMARAFRVSLTTIRTTA